MVFMISFGNSLKSLLETVRKHPILPYLALKTPYLAPKGAQIAPKYHFPLGGGWFSLNNILLGQHFQNVKKQYLGPSPA
jgi:hypothetical protein